MTDELLDLTESQIADLKEAFLLFDQDGNGEIAKDELQLVLRELGQNVTEDEVVEMMSRVDLDGSGSICLTEFIKMMSMSTKNVVTEEEILQGFKFFDKDGDGSVSKVELKRILDMIGEQLTEEEVEEMMAVALDVSGPITSQVIQYEQFRRVVMHPL
eukprot:TRINITY_DN10378_c0_g5_i1.p1 TRINITY_DN10378_c0_g5~~TRINITY_DN10378_c0_g5_i1.p1  ORF type:complete len:158 (+),score=50.15 TRINITY_DN10378_c0_g5_i1:74-547(+)